MAKKSTSLLQLMEQNKYLKLTFLPEPKSQSMFNKLALVILTLMKSSAFQVYIATRADMNHASEIFSFDMKKSWKTIIKCKRLSMILWR
jgi:predicted secreted protein